TVQVYDGPYGLYVKQGKVNASLPEGKGADDITLKEAVELLAAKAATKKSSRKSASAKKPAAKKSTAKKPAAKKPAAKKPPATTKSGRLRASAVRVIRPADS
ncbi:MAG: topoisomerase C-terminal repeat-containing protein, partial [Cyanobacteriota bacterium]|nr:topoisomerase C-terminal repeat-containing protein [Cyanobacteriota bacterium]